MTDGAPVSSSGPRTGPRIESQESWEMRVRPPHRCLKFNQMKQLEFNIAVYEDGGYVSVYDYLKLVLTKNPKLHNRIKAISNHEGMLEIYFDENEIHYRDAALLSVCFDELGDDGYNVCILNMENQVINIIGNHAWTMHWKYAPLNTNEFIAHK